MPQKQLPVKNKLISKKLKLIAVVLSVCIFIITLILNGFMRIALADFGTATIYDLQNPPSDSSKTFFNIISFIGSTVVIGPLIALIFLFSYRKINAIVFIVYTVANIFFFPTANQAFQDARPFWKYDFIDQLGMGCITQYGFPSGHVYTSVILIEPMLTDFTGLGKFGWAYVILLLEGILMPIARLYEGAHSADQVLVSSTLGVAMLVLYRYRLQKLLYKFIDACITTTKYRKHLALGIVLVNLLVIASPIILFEVNTKARLLDQQILSRLNRRCQIQLTHYQIQKNHSVQQALGNALFGALYGLLLTSCFLDQDWWMCYYYGQWKYILKRNVIYKLLMYGAFTGVSAIVFIFLIPSFIDNFYGAYFVSVFGMLLAGITLTLVVPLLARKGMLLHKKKQCQIPEIIPHPQTQVKDTISSKNTDKNL